MTIIDQWNQLCEEQRAAMSLSAPLVFPARKHARELVRAAWLGRLCTMPVFRAGAMAALEAIDADDTGALRVALESIRDNPSASRFVRFARGGDEQVGALARSALDSVAGS